MYWVAVGKGGVDDDRRLRVKKLIDISTAPTFPLDNDELYKYDVQVRYIHVLYYMYCY